MTLKEIAQLANVGKTTVQDWIKKMNENRSDLNENGSSNLNEIRSGILEKIAKARKDSKPADFTLEETIAIVRAGGNETLANLLAENAKAAHPEQASISGETAHAIASEIYQSFAMKIVPLIVEAVSGRKPSARKEPEQKRLPALPNAAAELFGTALGMRLEDVEDEIRAINARAKTSPTDYYTVAGYCALKGIKVDINRASIFGRKAGKLSAENGFDVHEVPDPRFGRVKTYPIEILDLVFEKSAS